LDFRIECDDFFVARFFAQKSDYLGRERGNVVAEMDQTLNTRGMLDPTMMGRIHEFGKNVSGEHRLDKPDRPAARSLLEAHTRRKAVDIQVAPQSRGRNMLMLGLGL
jgi:hypothetical protein